MRLVSKTPGTVAWELTLVASDKIPMECRKTKRRFYPLNPQSY